MASLSKLMQGILQNQQTLAEAAGIELPYAATDLTPLYNNVRAQSAIELPWALRRTMRHDQAFQKAVDKGYIQATSEGRLQWTLGSHTLFAYFAGRLWCSDKSILHKRSGKSYWHRGKGILPQASLCELFGERNLKQLRQNRADQRLPELFELVDKLFL